MMPKHGTGTPIKIPAISSTESNIIIDKIDAELFESHPEKNTHRRKTDLGSVKKIQNKLGIFLFATGRI